MEKPISREQKETLESEYNKAFNAALENVEQFAFLLLQNNANRSEELAIARRNGTIAAAALMYAAVVNEAKRLRR